jgi:hypothetical protein
MPLPPAQPSGARLGDGQDISFSNRGFTFTDADGSTQHIDFDASNVIPPQVPVIVAIAFTGLIGMILAFPIGRAIARYLDRRAVAPAVPDDLGRRLTAIEQAVDTVAVELERLSEANRFTTRLLSERVQAPDFSARAAERPDAAGVRQSSVRADDAIRG